MRLSTKARYGTRAVLDIAMHGENGPVTLSGIAERQDLFDDRLAGYRASTLVSIHADSCDYINDLATGYKVSAPLADPHPEQAARLTACLRNRYAQVTGLTLHNSVTTDMTSYHAFSEINEDTPAAIFEVGFLNLDRAILTQQPELVTKGISDGILCFLNNENVEITP